MTDHSTIEPVYVSLLILDEKLFVICICLGIYNLCHSCSYIRLHGFISIKHSHIKKNIVT